LAITVAEIKPYRLGEKLFVVLNVLLAVLCPSNCPVCAPPVIALLNVPLADPPLILTRDDDPWLKYSDMPNVPVEIRLT
jgi:hypothetical protein